MGKDDADMPQPDAFRALYEQYADLVYCVALSYLHVRAEAEDITADVFVQILEDDIQFDDDIHARAWLITAVRNRCKNFLRSWYRRKRADVDTARLETPDSDNRILGDAMAALAALPELYRLPLMLTAVEGYSIPETAKMLHSNESTIRTRISRARAIIRRKLGES